MAEPLPPHNAQPSQSSNSLGLAGFIVSLIGTCGTGGLLAPIGLIMSLIALGREPRGFAIAGVVIGLLGTCGGAVALLAFGGILLAALGGAGLVVVAALWNSDVQDQYEMAKIDDRLAAFYAAEQKLPEELGQLAFPEPDDTTDHLGNPYIYERIDAQHYRLFSLGEDGLAGTKDDLVYHSGPIEIMLRDENLPPFPVE